MEFRNLCYPSITTFSNKNNVWHHCSSKAQTASQCHTPRKLQLSCFSTTCEEEHYSKIYWMLIGECRRYTDKRGGRNSIPPFSLRKRKRERFDPWGPRVVCNWSRSFHWIHPLEPRPFGHSWALLESTPAVIDQRQKNLFISIIKIFFEQTVCVVDAWEEHKPVSQRLELAVWKQSIERSQSTVGLSMIQDMSSKSYPLGEKCKANKNFNWGKTF